MKSIVEDDVQIICKERLPWHNLQNKKILITGANGALPSYIVFVLLECNEMYNLNLIVYGLCRNSQKAESTFENYLGRKDFKLFYQDVCDEIDDQYKSDIIIHAASPSNTYIVQSEPYKVIEANVLACDKLLRKCKKWNSTDYIQFSSSAVYGDNTPIGGADELYRSEIDFTDNRNVYCMAKQMSEMMTSSIEGQLKCNIRHVRPFVVYGPGAGYSHKTAITDFIKNYIHDEEIILKSDGSAIRSYVYISDAIRAFFYVLLKAKNGVYNIASEKNSMSIKELASIFCDLGKDMSITFAQKLGGNGIKRDGISIMTGKSAKLEALGWHEKIELEEGIMRTISWAKRNDFINI